MPMTTELRDRPDIVYIEASDPLTLQDFEDSFAKQTEILNKATGKVHLFVTVHGLRQMPSGVLRVRQKAPIFSHPNAGTMVIVGAATVIRFIADMISQLARYKQIRFFDTEAQAWAFLEQEQEVK
jgi:hypothetical protein